MPLAKRSLAITDHYRRDLAALVHGVTTQAKRDWRGLSWDDLRTSYQPIHAGLYARIQTAQRDAVRLTAGYLGAYLTSELGERQPTPIVDTSRYVGKSYGEKKLYDSLLSPLIATLSANKERKPDPMGIGWRVAMANIDLDVKAAARASLADLMERDERIVGWKRAVKGTCDACMGMAEGSTLPPNTPLDIHPGCQCVSEAVVKTKPEVVAPPGYDQQIRSGLNAIESVHDYPADMPNTSIFLRRIASGTKGECEILRSGKASISIDTEAGADTLLHEMGHRLDAALGDGEFLSGQPAGELVDEMRGVLGAIRESNAYETLTTSPEVILELDPRYAKDARELIARAYAQWIGDRTGIKVGSARAREIGLQWRGDDFKPIAKALEKLFRAKGLLK